MSINKRAVEWAENVVKDVTHSNYIENSKHVIESLLSIVKGNEALEIVKEKWHVIKEAENVLENVAPQYFFRIGRETILALIAALQKDEAALRSENDRLKRACRYMYLTLGYYGTPYNYDRKNWATHPLTGEIASGIMHDGGRDARDAHAAVHDLGFTQDEIGSWGGPKP